MEVTLSEILNARENRARMQKSLLSRGFPIISFSMNIAGPTKNSPSIERAFFEGRRILEERLDASKIKHTYESISPTGCEAIYCVDEEPSVLKAMCVKIEDSCRLGRLFDLDVIDTDGRKSERKQMRACLICGKRGRECSASRAHSAEALQKETAGIIRDYFIARDASHFAVLAEKSLLRELYTTPKPGLVDKSNNGSHPDMSIEVFERSAHALVPYFRECFLLGTDTGTCLREDFLRLRELGVKAEEQMLTQTGGVNTHKGAVFCFGLILYSLGALWREDTPTPDTDRLFSVCAEMASHALSDLSCDTPDTAGKRLFAEKKIKGVRGEAALGFVSVREIALPTYEKALACSYTENDAGVLALLSLIAEIDDTTLYKRGGGHGVAFARDYAKRILREHGNMCESGSDERMLAEVKKMDDEFISRNLSVGGCADLLALCYFIHGIKTRKM